jgi:tetratricopeptide (TPR) repeat protein
MTLVKVLMAAPVIHVIGSIVAISFVLTSPTAAQEPSAKELQRRATARVASYRESVRKTGNKALRADELQQAVQELDQAYRAFLAADKDSEAAACRIGIADAFRLQGKFEEALTVYAEGETLARKANASASLARALIAQSRTRLFDTKDIEGARAGAAVALRVSSALQNKNLLFDALCLRCEVDLARSELFSAFDWIGQAMALRTQVTDQALLFYAYHDRSAVCFQFAKLCESRSAYGVCYQSMKLALRDATEALGRAKKLDWDFIAMQADKVLRSTQLLYWAIEIEVQKRRKPLPSSDPINPRDVRVTEEFLSTEGDKPPAQLIELAQKWEAADRDDAVRAYARAQLAHTSEQSDEALAGHLRAVELLERDYRALQDIEARGTLLAPKIDFYSWPMLHLLQRRKVPEAFQMMEAWRSRTLTDLLMTRAKV